MNRSIFGPGLASLCLTVPLFTSCTRTRPEAEVLKANQAKWQAAHIAHYRYTFQINTFGLPNATAPVIIEVLNGQRTSLTRPRRFENGLIIDPHLFDQCDTIDKVFQLTQKALDNNVEHIDLKFDATLGYPTYIRLDNSATVSDGVAVYTIDHFEIVNSN